MTKSDSYDQINFCDETDSFLEVARKLGRGFAARARDHDETGNFVAENFGELEAQRLMNPAGRRWLFIMPQDWRWWVWLVTGLPAFDWSDGYARSFSHRASTSDRSICFILGSGTRL
jgi:hypothetical protein